MNRNRKYQYFIVVLTKSNKLVSSYVYATSVANALDKMIEEFDLAGQVKEYKFCVRQTKEKG